jgi:hypothetical protein
MPNLVLNFAHVIACDCIAAFVSKILLPSLYAVSCMKTTIQEINKKCVSAVLGFCTHITGMYHSTYMPDNEFLKTMKLVLFIYIRDKIFFNFQGFFIPFSLEI